MKNHNLATLALSVILVSQLLSAQASEVHNLKETLLTSNIEALEDPYFQIGKPILEEITEEQAAELLGDDPEAEISTNLLEVPEIYSGPRDSIKSNNLGRMQSSYFDDEDDFIFSGGMNSSGRIRSRNGSMNAASNVIMMADDLVAIGQKVSDLVKQGKPVISNKSMSSVSVLPIALSKVNVDGTMANWSNPKKKNYTAEYQNGFGITVAKILYSVSFQHSGTYKGKGKYLNGIRVSARNIDVMFGYTLEAKSKIIDISNTGTTTNVVASAQIEMEYTVKNISRAVMNADLFFVKGDGSIIKQ